MALETKYEEAAYLSKVKPGMSGIHSTLINDNYVNKYESSMSVVETQYSQSRYIANLNSPDFGATSQAYLPTQALIGETYLIIELGLTDGVDGNRKFLLPTGWGLRLINNITYTMPSDTIGQVTITNDEMYHYLYCQSKEYTSTTELFKLMGPSTPSAGAVPPANPYDSTAPNFSATVLLPLPWCSLGPDTKPLDATIFGSGQIFINITFAQPGAVYQTLPLVGDTGTRVLKIKSAKLTFRQGEITNKEFSLRNLMLRNPSFIYDMPYIRSQTKTVGVLGENGGYNIASRRVDTFVSGLLNSDLVGMCISAHYVPESGRVGDPYVAMPIYDLTVTFGGLVLYNSPSFSHRLFNFQSALSAGYDANSVYSDTPVQNFPHIINFSRLRSMNWEDHYFNVMKFNAQTFNISFGTPDLASPPTNFSANKVEVRVTMFYNAVFELGQYRTQQRLL